MRVLLVQLKSGHCPATSYYKRRIEGQTIGMCDRCSLEDDKDHWFLCYAVAGVRVSCGIGGIGDLANEEAVAQYKL